MESPVRLNKYIASSTGMSRRAADQVIADGRITINDRPATQGQTVIAADTVRLDGTPITTPQATTTILLNKPEGVVVSRDGQGSPTIYDILPAQYHKLKPVGRLDKNSSGLLLLTNDGNLAQQLTHPTFQKTKRYEIRIDTALQPLHRQMIAEFGLQLDDGPSKLGLERKYDDDETQWIVIMQEGRNRQIRRTFSALGYTVTALHRVQFGPYQLPPDLLPGKILTI